MITYGEKKQASNLRSNLRGIVNFDHPGFYKWWARREDFKCLLFELGVPSNEFNKYETLAEQDGEWIAFYVGIAVKESVYSRLKWHLLQNHTPSAIKYRTLSTLRQSISALISKNMSAKDKVNAFMDKCVIEWWYSDQNVGSAMAMKEIKQMENDALKSDGKLYILNIQENKNLDAQSIKKTLKKKRDCAFCAAMEEMQNG